MGKESDSDPKVSYVEKLKKKILACYTEYAEDKEEYREKIEQSSLSSEHKVKFNELL